MITDEKLNKYLGKIITKVKMSDSSLVLSFDDGSKIELFDDGQYCCESRYMTCDDDLDSLVGCILNDVTVKAGPSLESDESHEQQFLEIATNKGFITIANHNEHNGYYGGFDIIVKEIT